MSLNVIWRAVVCTENNEEIHAFVEAPDCETAQMRCYERLAEEWNVAKGFIDIYNLWNETELRDMAILRIFISNHILFLVMMNVISLTERSDRCRETLRSENDLSVIGIIRPAVVSSTPFLCVFSVLYFSGVICSAGNSGSPLKTGGEV